MVINKFTQAAIQAEHRNQTSTVFAKKDSNRRFGSASILKKKSPANNKAQRRWFYRNK